MTTPYSGGDLDGAMAVYTAFVKNGTVPKLWTQKATAFNTGVYTTAVTSPGAGQPGIGTITWRDSAGKKQQLHFGYDASGKVTETPSPGNIPNASNWLQKIAIWISPKLPPAGTAAGQDAAGKVNAGANAVKAGANVVMSTAEFLSKLSNPAMWKRIGIGGLAIMFLIIAAVIVLRKPATQIISEAKP